jgi:hypothetical protein
MSVFCKQYAYIRDFMIYLTFCHLKSTIFWDITPCSLLIVNRLIGGTRCSACHLLSRWFLCRLILRPWRWRRYVPPKRRLTFNGLHIISQKIVRFITTIVRTSDPTYCHMLVTGQRVCIDNWIDWMLITLTDLQIITLFTSIYNPSKFVISLLTSTLFYLHKHVARFRDLEREL